MDPPMDAGIPLYSRANALGLLSLAYLQLKWRLPQCYLLRFPQEPVRQAPNLSLGRCSPVATEYPARPITRIDQESITNSKVRLRGGYMHVQPRHLDRFMRRSALLIFCFIVTTGLLSCVVATSTKSAVGTGVTSASGAAGTGSTGIGGSGGTTGAGGASRSGGRAGAAGRGRVGTRGARAAGPAVRQSA